MNRHTVILFQIAAALLSLLDRASADPQEGNGFGTYLVRDIKPGVASSNPSYLVWLDGWLYFQADNGVNGVELWRSNGDWVEEGTELRKDIWPGAEDSFPQYLIAAVPDKLFFSANDGTNGFELWMDDGTAASPVMVKDIYPGSFSSNPLGLSVVNWGRPYFKANDGTNGTELWKSDGTPTGTMLVRDINPDPLGFGPRYITEAGGPFFFVANDGIHGWELWKSDGTPNGTFMVSDINPFAQDSNPEWLIYAGNNTLYFVANDGISGRELYRSDGTAAATYMVKDIDAGAWSSDPRGIVLVNGTLYFSARHITFPLEDSKGVELWKSDGTANGTVLVKDIRPGVEGSYPAALTQVGDRIFFSADDGTHGVELWTSDGTEAGTLMVVDHVTGMDINPGPNGSFPNNYASIGEVLFFTALDGTGSNLIRVTVGKIPGENVKVYPWRGPSYGSAMWITSGLILINDDIFTGIYYVDQSPLSGRELWASIFRSHGDIYPCEGDGVVDLDDLITLLLAIAGVALESNLGGSSCYGQPDLYPCAGGDGIVDIDDLLALLGAFANEPFCPW